MSALDGLIARVLQGQGAISPIPPPPLLEPQAEEPWAGEIYEEEATGITTPSTAPLQDRSSGENASEDADNIAPRHSPPPVQFLEKHNRLPLTPSPPSEASSVKATRLDPASIPKAFAKRTRVAAAERGAAPQPALGQLEPVPQQHSLAQRTSAFELSDRATKTVPSTPSVEFREAAPAAEIAPADRVTIEIGRIEVATPARAQPRMLTLEDYRTARCEGRR